jgi:hypothetical protein
MFRFCLTALAGLLVLASGLRAQNDIQRGTVKKIDGDQGVITITVDGQDREFLVTNTTRVFGAERGDAAARLKEAGIKEGSRVLFKPVTNEARAVLIGVKLDDNTPARQQPPPKVDTSHFKPLTELGRDEYHGFQGGLYPEGKNERPASHEAAGVALAGRVRPLDADGQPRPDGKIVLLGVGMSNTSQAFTAFERLANSDPDKNPHVVLVNGAQGGMTAFAIQDPDDQRNGTRYWTTVDERLKAAGVTRAQVQAIWIKQADAGPTQGFPKYAQTLQAELGKIAQLLPARFPNVKLVYLSPRTYGGYAKTRLNPEPYAYESGFSVKWLIEQQLKGDPALNYDPAIGAVRAPWLSWGPYLWANGSAKRADGFNYEESDFAAADGTHESPSGQRKVAKLLLDFFKTDRTTRGWFVR